MKSFLITETPIISFRKAKQIISDKTISDELVDFFVEYTAVMTYGGKPHIALRGHPYYKMLLNQAETDLASEIDSLNGLLEEAMSMPYEKFSSNLQIIISCLTDHLESFTAVQEKTKGVREIIDAERDIYDMYFSYPTLKDYLYVTITFGGGMSLLF